MPPLHIEKFANAFIPLAVPSARVAGPARGAVNHYGEKHGGLWVGGKVVVTSEALNFVPNRMNVALHQGLEPISIPFGSIRSARREFGWVTGIVAVEHAHGAFRFRCFGAKGVAEEMAAHLHRRS
jgi:hypothetical protein